MGQAPLCFDFAQHDGAIVLLRVSVPLRSIFFASRKVAKPLRKNMSFTTKEDSISELPLSECAQW